MFGLLVITPTPTLVLLVNTVLFDNMSIKNLKKGVKIAKKFYETEASGNISLKNIKSKSNGFPKYQTVNPEMVRNIPSGIF